MYDSRPDTFAHILTVQGFMQKAIFDLMERQRVHDQSKLVSPEVEVFDEFTPKLKDSTYGSEEYKGFLASMGRGLEAHYYRNRHHPEYFCIDESGFYPEQLPTGQAIGHMNLLDLTEMLCDWKAASLRHTTGDIRKSIEVNQVRFGYSDELKRILLNTLEVLERSE